MDGGSGFAIPRRGCPDGADRGAYSPGMPSRDANACRYPTTFLACTPCTERDYHVMLMMYVAAGRAGRLVAAEVA